jgi:CheY-like chemotaxis protein
LIYFLILFAAALIVAVSFVFFHQRKMEKEQQHFKASMPDLPSVMVTSISTNRLFDQPYSGAIVKTTTNSVPQSAGLHYKILVVDDQPYIRKMLAELFTAQGIEVYEAENGSIALDIYEQQWPNCVLLDLKMPDINGIDILKGIRILSPEVPVILITAYADPEKMEEALALGITECFTKPFDIIELKGLVLGILEQSSNQAE